MKRFRITIETQNLVSIAVVEAESEEFAWALFREKLHEQNPAHFDEISSAKPMFRELAPLEKVTVGYIGNNIVFPEILG